MLAQDNVAALLPHSVELLRSVLVAVKLNLVTHISRLCCQVLQEGQNLIQSSVIGISIELGQDDHISLVVRGRLFLEVDVDNLLDWSA